MTLSTVAPDVHIVPFTPWREFFDAWQWQLGEHVTVVGPTGTGKTTLIRALLRKRYLAGGAVNVLATKPRDLSLSSWARHDGLTVIRDWPPRRNLNSMSITTRAANRLSLSADGREIPWDMRLMTWPVKKGAPLNLMNENMQDVFRRSIHDMFWAGNWTIAAEELLTLSTILGLERDLVTLWTQGRSSGVTVIGGTQRPMNIPLYAYSQASHLFMFGDNDDRNLDRLKGIGGMNGRALIDLVRTLPYHDVLWIDTRGRRDPVRTRVPVQFVKGGTINA